MYHDSTNDHRLLSIERKQFIYSDQNFFTDPHNFDWVILLLSFGYCLTISKKKISFKLMKQDKELNHFHGTLWEFDRHFLPSYPFEENINMITTASSSKMIANSYMKTRCPAWCDRVLMNNTAKQLLIKNENQQTKIHYEMMGNDSPMGDHKVILFVLNTI